MKEIKKTVSRLVMLLVLLLTVAPHTGSVEQNFRKEVTKWTK